MNLYFIDQYNNIKVTPKRKDNVFIDDEFMSKSIKEIGVEGVGMFLTIVAISADKKFITLETLEKCCKETRIEILEVLKLLEERNYVEITKLPA